MLGMPCRLFLFVWVGAVIAQGTKDYESTFSWRFPIAFNVLITLLLFVGSFFVDGQSQLPGRDDRTSNGSGRDFGEVHGYTVTDDTDTDTEDESTDNEQWHWTDNGRKGALRAAVIIVTIGCILQLIIVGSVSLLIVGRLILGKEAHKDPTNSPACTIEAKTEVYFEDNW
jgi:hypothetical protein